MGNFDENTIPEEYKPLSIGKFLGLSVLWIIPCVGLICMIVFACGAVKNKNIINYARAELIFIGIAFAIYFIMMLMGVGLLIFNSAQSVV